MYSKDSKIKNGHSVTDRERTVFLLLGQSARAEENSTTRSTRRCSKDLQEASPCLSLRAVKMMVLVPLPGKYKKEIPNMCIHIGCIGQLYEPPLCAELLQTAATGRALTYMAVKRAYKSNK